jgi:hypothetical protein
VVISALFLLVWHLPPFSLSQADLSPGHSQPEHETNHGSTSATRRAIESLKENSDEPSGLKLNEDAPPLLCHLACTSLGRHVHVDYCRGDPHDNPGVQHISERMGPNPDQEKDWITHGLYWRRMGERAVQTFRSILPMNPLYFQVSKVREATNVKNIFPD